MKWACPIKPGFSCYSFRILGDLKIIGYLRFYLMTVIASFVDRMHQITQVCSPGMQSLKTGNTSDRGVSTNTLAKSSHFVLEATLARNN